MRGIKAKAIRRKARAVTAGLPYATYDVEETGVVYARKPDGSIDPLRHVKNRTFRLREDCVRWMIQSLKAA